MLSAFFVILHSPALRVATIALVIAGLTSSATIPYLPLVAIKEFGLSDHALSILLFLSGVAGLVYSVSIAVVSDMVADRKPLLLGVLLVGILGFGLIYLVPDISVFVLCAVLLIPLAGSSYSLSFATIRALSNQLAADEARAITSIARTMFSAAWILVPGLVALWITDAPSMLGAWGFSAIACLVGFVTILVFMPRADRESPKPDDKLSFFASLKLALAPMVLARVVSMAMITSASRLVMILQPLIMTGNAGGTLVDVGIVAGACAALEIPFMLFWGSLLKRLTVIQTLAVGAVIYAAFLGLLSLATQPMHIYMLLIPNALGLAAILTMPLAYFQDIWQDRPGLGTSLYQMTAFVANGLSAGAFAVGASMLGYSGTTWVGVAMIFLGISGLFAIERRVAVHA